MAAYALRMAGLEGAVRALFIDDQTPVNPEYQSTLMLIGLKQLLGVGCEVAFPADFIYLDSRESSAHFYGRGFGYSYVVDPATRTPAESSGVWRHGLDDLSSYDLVVIGSTSRNAGLISLVADNCDPDRVIAIHGEDGPPSDLEFEHLRSLGFNTFVRAIHKSH
jgi:hypothetical protein